MKKNLFRKMWWDGRMGHSSYLMFALQLVNFLLITYNFLIDGNKIFETFISDLWVFVTIVTIFYIPISVLIGKWHTDTQLRVEMEMKLFEEPMTAKMIKGLLNVKEGVYNEEEIIEFRKFLTDIEKGDIKEF
jgi:hypothetical protein